MISNQVRDNNIDLLRLLAATQVAVTHLIKHFDLQVPVAVDLFLRQIPGVPIFFCLSGYLIYQSYANTSSPRSYFVNRVLRLFPALWVCLAVSLLLVFLSGYKPSVTPTLTQWITWLGAQISFAQFYNAPFLREYGDGVLNGSLWTIAVEIQFYILAPVLYLATRRFGARVVFGIVLVVTVAANLAFIWHKFGELNPSVWLRLFQVSFFPWFHMFVLGVLFSIRSDWVDFCVRHRVALTILYIVIVFTSHYLGFADGNLINPVQFVFLCMAMMGWVFTNRTLSTRLLRKNDYSYGIYIFHMPVINYFIEVYSVPNLTLWHVTVAAILIAALAIASWFVVERTALRLKRSTIFVR
jgi:peptidoglycan/LPS O-acetylase OafA/YrhL